MRDVEAAVQSPLERAEDARARRGPLEPRVQEHGEGPGGAIGGLDGVVLSRGLLEADVGVGEAELGQRAAGDEQADGVGGGVVGEPDLEAVARELVRVRADHDDIAGERGGDDLADDVLGGEADDEAVLGGVEPDEGERAGARGKRER